MKYKPNPISHTPQISNINVGCPRYRTDVTPLMLFMSIDLVRRCERVAASLNHPARTTARSADWNRRPRQRPGGVRAMPLPRLGKPHFFSARLRYAAAMASLSSAADRNCSARRSQ